MKLSSNKGKRIAALALALMLLSAMLIVPASAWDAGTLNISLVYGSTPIENGQFALYYVASLDADSTANLPKYTYTEAFAACGVDLQSSILSSSALADAAEALLDHIEANTLEPVATLTTNDQGAVSYTIAGEYAGMYLVVPTSAPRYYEMTESFLVSVPTSEGGSETVAPHWNYEVTASPKIDYNRPTNPPPDNTRPVTTPVPTPVTTPVVTPGLAEEIILDDVPLTEIVEDVPLTEIPDEVPLGPAPQTGQLNWPIPVLLCLGVVLVVIGMIVNERKKYNAE